ncbi:MAG TPA: hypothetical protein VGG90_10925 [Candidatus Dormibacteraeota bacterium]|jgi:hypothetical protein
MPITPARPSAWLWSVYFGLFIGGGVVLVSGLRYGFSLALLVLGLVLALVFAIAGVLAGVARRYTPGGPT